MVVRLPCGEMTVIRAENQRTLGTRLKHVLHTMLRDKYSFPENIEILDNASATHLLKFDATSSKMVAKMKQRLRALFSVASVLRGIIVLRLL